MRLNMEAIARKSPHIVWEPSFKDSRAQIERMHAGERHTAMARDAESAWMAARLLIDGPAIRRHDAQGSPDAKDRSMTQRWKYIGRGPDELCCRPYIGAIVQAGVFMAAAEEEGTFLGLAQII